MQSVRNLENATKIANACVACSLDKWQSSWRVLQSWLKCMQWGYLERSRPTKCVLCRVLMSINFQNFDQNIKCSEKYWIKYSKYQATKNRWSYHLVWMRKHTYMVSLKEFLKLFKCLASSGIHTVCRWLDLLFKALHQERKGRKGRIPTTFAWALSVVVILPLFIEIWYKVFS